jgi:hypothetical protein
VATFRGGEDRTESVLDDVLDRRQLFRRKGFTLVYTFSLICFVAMD